MKFPVIQRLILSGMQKFLTFCFHNFLIRKYAIALPIIIISMAFLFLLFKIKENHLIYEIMLRKCLLKI